jgi:hypothetical protein
METLGQHLAWNKTAQRSCEADKTVHVCACVCMCVCAGLDCTSGPMCAVLKLFFVIFFFTFLYILPCVPF